jgi:hypothetical protein
MKLAFSRDTQLVLAVLLVAGCLTTDPICDGRLGDTKLCSNPDPCPDGVVQSSLRVTGSSVEMTFGEDVVDLGPPDSDALPGCTVIAGGVTVTGAAPSLAVFDNIETVHGTIKLIGATSGRDNVFPKLTSAGAIEISEVFDSEVFDGFHALIEVGSIGRTNGGYMYLTAFESLRHASSIEVNAGSISGFPALEDVPGMLDLNVGSSILLGSLVHAGGMILHAAGEEMDLTRLTSVDGQMQISGDPLRTQRINFDSLGTVGNSLSVTTSVETSLAHWHAPRTVGANLTLMGHTALTSAELREWAQGIAVNGTTTICANGEGIDPCQ